MDSYKSLRQMYALIVLGIIFKIALWSMAAIGAFSAARWMWGWIT